MQLVYVDYYPIKIIVVFSHINFRYYQSIFQDHRICYCDLILVILSNNSEIQLIHYYVSTLEEFNNPANFGEGTTGNMLYTINEVYVHPDEIGDLWRGISGNGEAVKTL